MCKGWETGVPSVPSGGGAEAAEGLLLNRVVDGGGAGNESPEGAGQAGPLPYLTANGTLVIPFDSPERYHWWKPDGERLHVWEIRAEVLADGHRRRMEVAKGKEEHGTGV